MSDLTDFLLARIAEDEDSARMTKAIFDAQPFAERAAAQFVSGAGFQRPNGLGTDDRVLAECDTKRRIVNVLSSPDPHDASEGCPECCALYLLALPYADHPDYREEWRP